MTNPGDQGNVEGDTVSLAVSASDAGSGTLHFVAFGLPAGLKINSGTGAITGTVARNAAAGGPYTVTLVANDGTYSAAQTFAWTVTSPVSLTAPADQSSLEGASVSLSMSASYSGSGTLNPSSIAARSKSFVFRRKSLFGNARFPKTLVV